ncbi:hypothetical protein R1flu_016693 [Riccia fluitans]|uniref:Uroporphyrinogen-III synthase n=1 Tax=Riccia fluitans TaxID=41844 RepID=A0ABD1YQL5_9MARC
MTGVIVFGASFCSGMQGMQTLSSSSRTLLWQKASNLKFLNEDISLCGGPENRKKKKKKQVSLFAKSRNIYISPYAGQSKATVVVTREQGKNGKLMNALSARGISCLELPLIEHKEGADYPKLANTLRENEFEWVVVTSPEAAAVFLSGWRAASFPKVRIAVVGSGTGEVFEEARDDRINVAFTPSKATAKVLVVELPKQEGGNGEILYPSSAKAGSDLEIGLSERGFKVLRLNTYSTESVKSLDPEKVAAAIAAPVATFASPTAVRAWIELVGPWNGAAACIGTTSAKAAKSAGLCRVFCPESPGIDGWVESVMEALDSMCSLQA